MRSLALALLSLSPACGGDAADGARERPAASRVADTEGAASTFADTAYANAAQHASSASETPTHDDAGAPLPVPDADAHVVSLTPSATELIAAIGRLDRLVGRTTWDDYPAEVRDVADLGPGLRPNVEAVLAVRPTLVVLYASPENVSAARTLRAAGVDVVSLRAASLADVGRAARVLGHVLAAPDAAAAFVDSIDATLARVRAAVAGAGAPRVVWPSWESPLMVVGGGSYEQALLEAAGAVNVFGDRTEPVVTVTLEEVARRDPDIVLAAPSRLARLRAQPGWRALRAVREGRLVPLDTTVVGRPGARIGMAAAAIARALHPERAAALP